MIFIWSVLTEEGTKQYNTNIMTKEGMIHFLDTKRAEIKYTDVELYEVLEHDPENKCYVSVKNKF